jgi:hypothetical protein
MLRSGTQSLSELTAEIFPEGCMFGLQFVKILQTQVPQETILFSFGNVVFQFTMEIDGMAK